MNDSTQTSIIFPVETPCSADCCSSHSFVLGARRQDICTLLLSPIAGLPAPGLFPPLILFFYWWDPHPMSNCSRFKRLSARVYFPLAFLVIKPSLEYMPYLSFTTRNFFRKSKKNGNTDMFPFGKTRRHRIRCTIPIHINESIMGRLPSPGRTILSLLHRWSLRSRCIRCSRCHPYSLRSSCCLFRCSP